MRERSCERAELGNTKAAMKMQMKMEKEGKESECVKYLWMASDLGKMEATVLLAEIYRSGKMVDGDDEESRRLFGIVFQQAEGFKWE